MPWANDVNKTSTYNAELLGLHRFCSSSADEHDDFSPDGGRANDPKLSLASRLQSETEFLPTETICPSIYVSRVENETFQHLSFFFFLFNCTAAQSCTEVHHFRTSPSIKRMSITESGIQKSPGDIQISTPGCPRSLCSYV